MLFTLVAVVVAVGLAAGLVVWAAWVPPPVLRPAGLLAGPVTANSIAFRWSRPPTGPLPDKYLTPATSDQYRVVADCGAASGPRSPPSRQCAPSPHPSQAVLQGLWNVKIRKSQ